MLKRNAGRKIARPISAWAVSTTVACGTALTISVLRAQHPHIEKEILPGVRLTPAAFRLQNTLNAPETTPSVKIEVEAVSTQAADLSALSAALNGVLTADRPLSSGQEAASGSDTLPAWFTWGRLRAKRASVHISAPTNLPAEALGVYAVRSEEGVTLCLVNKTSARLLTNAVVRLSRGVYAIERLTLNNEKSEVEAGKGRPSVDTGNRETKEAPAPSPALLPASALPKLERLEGCDLGSTTTISKGLCLEPGQVCLYRYTDMARNARAAWNDVFTQLHAMAGHQPGPAHRLATMLHEADSYIGGVRGAGHQEGLQSRLGCVHHLLLVTAQAHSLHHNYQMRHTVDESDGKAVMGALDRLTDALSETSATLLGLVPQIGASLPTGIIGKAEKNATILLPAPAAIRLIGKEEKSSDGANIEAAAEENGRVIIVSLANTGAQSVHNVKLGLNTSNLPSGTACEPADPAYFDALHPGQTIRATFRLRVPSGQRLYHEALRGDVSYFAGQSPAHLRPRAW